MTPPPRFSRVVFLHACVAVTDPQWTHMVPAAAVELKRKREEVSLQDPVQKRSFQSLMDTNVIELVGIGDWCALKVYQLLVSGSKSLKNELRKCSANGRNAIMSNF